jgi:uncharacterized membrane protein
MDNPRSTASIAGHPIHPMLVPFPIAFFVGAFVTDLLFWRSLFTGWKGWKLVYLHRVGVSDKNSEAAEAAARLRVRG